jgi:lysophospholipase L1-like esterase
MADQTIFILGDSTSMSVGCERHMYPFVMADSSCWPDGTEIINCSQPGFTSADACAFFFRHWKNHPGLKAVVIYLGTCDAASWELRKGKYTFFRENAIRFRELCGLRKERTRLKNRLLPLEWNNTFNPLIELPETPEDYEFNISRIVKACLKSSIPVAVIRPKANRLFYPGLGKGNFVFYSYLGLHEKLSHKLAISDKRFVEAMSLQETGDFGKAAEKYREILLTSGPLSLHYEYPLLIVNNYAVCVAQKGELDEAESLLLLLLKERNVRREIVIFNMAEICRMRGDNEKYQKYLAESYEADCSMYRIREPYLKALDNISMLHGKNVGFIDIAQFIDDDLYVDHTHPLKEGQQQIANRIIECFRGKGLSGAHKAEIKNILYNPELSLGNNTEFFNYFRTYSAFSEKEIKEHLDCLRSANNTSEYGTNLLKSLPKELETAIKYHLQHPCFPELKFLVHFDPRYPSDVGRFPEYFLVRHIIPYVRFYEREQELKKMFPIKEGILRTSRELSAVLPGDVLSLVSGEDPLIESFLESQRLPAILAVCRKKLLNHLHDGNQVYPRIKTTIFWYFRETLRYGSHSRISMRYDRTLLEYIAEALAVAAILNWRLHSDHGQEIKELIQRLEETVLIHEQYCCKFKLSNESESLLEEYDGQLLKTANKLENH